MSLIAKANREIAKPNKETIVKYASNATTGNIISVILDADKEGFEDTITFSSNFDADNLHELWSFVRNKIKYVADPHGLEMVKRPSVLWNLRKGDCKSFSIFTASVLYNLGIPYSYRFVAWEKNEPYSHVYIVAHTPSGDVIMDSVHTQYNQEVPYSHHKDIKGIKPVAVSGIRAIGSSIKPLYVGIGVLLLLLMNRNAI